MADVTDMRGYIELLEEMGELRRFEGADLKTEVGALTGLAARHSPPACLGSWQRRHAHSRGTILSVWSRWIQISSHSPWSSNFTKIATSFRRSLGAVSMRDFCC